MSAPVEPFTEPATSKEEIFRATYLAQTENGYADLSIQQIADRASLSKSSIYHHFDSKDTLLMEYAERLLEWYIDELLFEPEGDPIEQLERSLDLVFLEETEDGLTLDDIRPPGLGCVYIGLRMEAAQDPEMRQYFDAMDSMARERLTALIERGIEEGTLQTEHPQQVGAVLSVMIEGALLLRSTETEIGWLREVRAMLDAYLERMKTDQ